MSLKLTCKLIAVYYFEKSGVKNQLGKYQEAFECLNRSTTSNPNYAKARYVRARLKVDLGNYETALEDFDKGILLDPQFVERVYHTGLMEMDSKDYLSAIEEFTAAKKICIRQGMRESLLENIEACKLLKPK